MLVHRQRPHRDFPVWHFAMVNDRVRNQAIERSIAALDLRGKTIVEIGTGTGLIALLFAKHGAARVITCEMNATLASAAQQIVNSTPYAERVTVIEGSSTDSIDRGLLPDAPDVIFTETLDCGVVGEGFWAIAADIQRIASAQTIVMPREVRQFATLVESVAMADLNRASSSCGFDLSPLNAYTTRTYFPVHAKLHQHRVLSAPQQIRRYRYLGGTAPAPVSLLAARTGTVHGLLSWFAADFGTATITNEPFSDGHWHQAFHPLPEDILVTEGDTISTTIDDAGCGRITHAPHRANHGILATPFAGMRST